MSFVITDTSIVFTNPSNVPFLPGDSNSSAVVATSNDGVQLGGGPTPQSPNTPPSTYTTVAAPAGQTVQLVVSGSGTRVNVAPGAANIRAVGGGAIVESAIGATVSTGDRKIELGGGDGINSVAYNGGVVATAAVVSGNGSGTQTIAQAAGNKVPADGFAYYGAGGSGNDQIEGSSLNDFIRGGAGNDTINGYGGNDVIRGGAGSDSIFGGAGADTLYYTSDQLDGSTDIIADFTAGTDKIAVQGSSVASTAAISGLGTSTITFTASGTKVISSNNTAINATDINIV